MQNLRKDAYIIFSFNYEPVKTECLNKYDIHIQFPVPTLLLMEDKWFILKKKLMHNTYRSVNSHAF